ncbi:Gfo/Idh/MocA family oxidoreductase [Parvularcula sp. LCG005]|uniref:Gfo/Idh/MocA family protein n=1 Tax=Parvularcula sp. LCG005 TaxID=3078805 RepID=UPI002942E48D|nr:Gfo/Idh/MocA family oxidoreductase [Parvularcula sp. LCG005]WOI54202.1 Gfo/Idh/MocA family oxidoreductase [Parvularcula sp. LCG005]
MPQINRRNLLAGTGAILGAAGSGGSAFAKTKPFSVGVVGAGWFGKIDSQALMQVAPVDFIAYADPDSNMLAEAGEQASNLPKAVRKLAKPPALYKNYKDMFAEHDFDIVIIDTPDHWHALPMIEAVSKGAHIYLQKPIGVDIAEGEAMVAAAKKSGKVVQVGLQRRSQPHLIEAKKSIIGSGMMGDIALAEVFCYFHQRSGPFGEITTPPDNLDWELYNGPAPEVAYRPGIHPDDWRSFLAFGSGYMGDVGVHFVDATRWLLDLGWPKQVYSAGGAFVDPDSPATTPDTQVATFQFDDLTMTWTNRVWGGPAKRGQPWGSAIHGENGSLWVAVDGFEYVPRDESIEPTRVAAYSDAKDFPHESSMQEWEQLTNTTNRTHMANFVNAIRTKAQPASPIEEGHISTSVCHMSNMSLKLGRALNVDPATGQFVDDEEATGLRMRPYRAPYKHPAV